MRNSRWRRWMTGVWKSLAGGPTQRTPYRGKVFPHLEDLENRLTPAAPSVLSILRSAPAGPITGASSVTYTIAFDQAVSGVDPTDFQLVRTGTVGTTLTQMTPVS